MRVRLLACFAVVLVGCGSQPPSDPEPASPVPAPTNPWVLMCNDPNAKTPALLWNGSLGVRIGRDGTGYDSDGKPLPAFMIDAYETTGEEKIKVCGNPLATRITVGDKPLSPVGSRDYMQSLDMKTGLLTTKWSQGATKVQVDTVIDPVFAQLAQQWTISPGEDRQLKIESEVASADGKGKIAVDRGKGRAVVREPVTGRGVTLVIKTVGVASGKWSSDPDGYQFAGTLAGGENVTITRTASVDIGGLDRPVEAPTFEQTLKRSREVWAERWKTDVLIDGPEEDQQTVRSILYYLRGSISKQPSPFGLSDSMYGGHVFWDADIWVFPALALLDPDVAKRIPAYRMRLAEAARENYRRWWSSGGSKAGNDASVGIKYPWESSVSGLETVRGPSESEIHITGSVLWGLKQASALGLGPDIKPLLEEGSQFFHDRSVDGPTGRELRGVMSPDENHTGDNDLYTNILAMWCGAGGAWPDKQTYKLPRDDKTFLTYDGDTLRSYKQAAAVLAIYPLQYPPAEKQARAMMERFADKPIKNGPAMTDSIHAIIWARFGETEKAYAAWRDSWEEFSRRPLRLFGEKRMPKDDPDAELRRPTYFTTGAAGSLQSVLYGFLGFRLDWKKPDGAPWAIPLRGGAWLSVTPHLPKSWKRVEFKNFTVLGKRYTLTATQNDVHVTQGD